MCTSRMRTKWILVNIQNNCRNMTDYVNRQVESSMLSDHRQRRPDDQKFDDDVAQKEGDSWLSEDAVNCQCLRMMSVFLQILRSFVLYTSTSCHPKLKTALAPEHQASEGQIPDFLVAGKS